MAPLVVSNVMSITLAVRHVTTFFNREVAGREDRKEEELRDVTELRWNLVVEVWKTTTSSTPPSPALLGLWSRNVGSLA